uniref:Uncharacterized protein n=1 Tax=Lepeophtheirus salmonis TaxID=72036 RepID=A0A0K2V742_LEPSM
MPRDLVVINQSGVSLKYLAYIIIRYIHPRN